MSTYSNVVTAAAELPSETCCRVKWSKKKKMYECTRCGYTSERKSNVGRHFRRIHCELKKHKVCVVCEMSFSTKGEFYEHSEKEHPHLRNSCFITSEKYKIGRKVSRRRRSKARSTNNTRVAPNRVSIDETSEEETNANGYSVNGNEDNKKSKEEAAEMEELEEVDNNKSLEEVVEYEIYEKYEHYEEYEGDDEISNVEQENVESMDYNVQKGDENIKINYFIASPYETDLQKVVVQEISELYTPIPYEVPVNDNSSSWSHKANESLTSSPAKSLRTDFLSPVLWSPENKKLARTPNSSTELDELTSSPARTIKTDDFIYSPARSFRTDDTSLSSSRSLKNNDFISSSENSDESDDYYLTSPSKVSNTNKFMSCTMNSDTNGSSSEGSLKADSPLSHCNMSPSDSDTEVKTNTLASLRKLPLKKRFGKFTQRKQLADITNIRNNIFNEKHVFNNNEMEVGNRNFSTINDHREAFFKNIDFDDLEAVLILKSLKESNN